MELEGAKALFTRSIVLHGVRYTGYYVDGDSKAYGEVKAYYGDDHSIIKYECIGHYQKRVGTRLRKLKKDSKGLKELSGPIIDFATFHDSSGPVSKCSLGGGNVF